MTFTSRLLESKVDLITGANSVIGNSVLSVFAENGAEIIVCVRTLEEDFFLQIENLKLKFKVPIHVIVGDLTDFDNLKVNLNSKLKEIGKIDVLVNNAGVAHGGLLQMTQLSKIREVFELNFFAQINLIQVVSKYMIKQKSGSIINLSSVAGLDAYPGYIAYGSSKAALIYSTKTLSKELAPYNIRINSVAPGLTDTNMAVQMEEKAKHKMINDSSMNRLAKPEEIANTVLYLASDLSSFINGQTIRVDGGM